MVGRLGVVAMLLISCVPPRGDDAAARSEPPAPRSSSPPAVAGREAYVSKVRPGHQVALNTAAVPFAKYLNGIHNRIHPIFADAYLSTLDTRPTTDPMNDRKLFTRVEIVVGRDGFIVTMGVVKTSGLAEFDTAALDAFGRAQPFGIPPEAILSPDGKTYIHWELHRDEVFACSTMNARPFLLRDPPAPGDQGAGVLQL